MPIKLRYGKGTVCKRTVKRKDGSIYVFYQGRIYDKKEKKQLTTTAKTQAECLKKMKKITLEVKNGIAKKTNYASMLFSSWLLEWFKIYKEPKNKETTNEKDFDYISNYIIPKLGNYKLNELREADIVGYLNNYIGTGNTYNKLLGLIKASFRVAVRSEKIDKNPCEFLKKITYHEEEKNPFEIYQQNELLNNFSDTYRGVFFLLCVTGLRPGEFAGIGKTDFDFEHQTAHVDKQKNRKREMTGPKTVRSYRNVFFLPELFDYFDINLLGTFTYNGLKKAFSREIKRLGYKNVSLYSTRHTYATTLQMLGVPEKIIQKQMGHSCPLTTDRYVHLLLAGDSIIYQYLIKLRDYLKTIYAF